MSVLVGKKAPVFNTSAVVNGNEIVEGFSLEQYKGKNMYYFSSTLRILHLYVQQKLSHSKKKLQNSNHVT